MKTIKFTCVLAEELERFVEFKKSCNFDYYSRSKLLRCFDRFLVLHKSNSKILSKQICHSYIGTLHHLSRPAFSSRLTVVRHFSIWLNQHDHRSYVLEKIPSFNRSHYHPIYIFSFEQIKEIIWISGGFGKMEEGIRGLYQTLFSLLYSTGIRINEALALDIDDYDPREKLIHIRKGKFHKERYLIVNDLLKKRLDKYLRCYEGLLLPQGDSPLFINIYRRRLKHDSVLYAFSKIIKKMGINKKPHTGPKIYSFRHTFAVHRLLKWYETEKDINAKLPLLATYMGHVCIRSTQVYLHATSELLEKGSERFHRFFLDHVKPSIYSGDNT